MAIDKAATKETLDEIEKKHGKGAMIRLGDKPTEKIPCIPTGSIALDAALGIGGVPRGRMVEIFGPESAGKTTLTLHIAAQCQKMGEQVAFIDAEHALDADYAELLGVKTADLLVSQPDNGEQALEIVETVLRKKSCGLVVVDSVAALVPRAEIEGEMGDSLPGLQARLMSQACRKLTAVVAHSGACLIFINQLRNKIGITFGNPEVTTGGRALQFYASVRLDIRRAAKLMDGDNQVGSRTRVKVVKNKVAPPFKVCEFDILYKEGISRTGELLDIGAALGVVTRKGAFYYYGEQKLGQGREAALKMLRATEETALAIEIKIRQSLGL